MCKVSVSACRLCDTSTLLNRGKGASGRNRAAGAASVYLDDETKDLLRTAYLRGYQRGRRETARQQPPTGGGVVVDLQEWLDARAQPNGTEN